MKHLGKPPKHQLKDSPLGTHCTCIDCFAHRHMAMLEAADEIDKTNKLCIARNGENCNTTPACLWCPFAKKLRISAGVSEKGVDEDGN